MYHESMLALKERIQCLEIEIDEVAKQLEDPNLPKRKLKSINFCLKHRYKHLNNQKAKRTLYLSQRGKCCFCEKPMFPDAEFGNPSKKFIATIEHVIPKFYGGKNDITNYKLSCAGCNNARGTMDFDKFKNRMDNPVIKNKSKKRKRNVNPEIKKWKTLAWALHVLYEERALAT